MPCWLSKAGIWVSNYTMASIDGEPNLNIGVLPWVVDQQMDSEPPAARQFTKNQDFQDCARATIDAAQEFRF